MKAFFARIHWPGVVSALTTAVGVISLPEVAALLPAHYATAVIAAGAVGQAVTKAVHSKGQE